MSRRRRTARHRGGRVFAFTDSECAAQVETITSILSKYSLRLSEIKMDHRNYLRKQMVKLTGGATDAPQIFLNSEYLGSVQTLVELHRSSGDELSSRLSALNAPSAEPGPLYEIYRNQQVVFDVFPETLYFPHPEGRTIRTIVILSNKTQLYGVFKVKTTKPHKYSVKPRYGVVPKDGEQRIEITLQRKSDRPSTGGGGPSSSESGSSPDPDTDDPLTDKFRIESFGIKTPVAGEEMINSLFDRVKRFQQQRLRCDFGDPPDYIKVTQEKLNVFLVEEDRERHMQQKHVENLSQQFMTRKQEEQRRREEAALRKKRMQDEEQRRIEREKRVERDLRERKRRERERIQREEAERLAEIARKQAQQEVDSLSLRASSGSLSSSSSGSGSAAVAAAAPSPGSSSASQYTAASLRPSDSLYHSIHEARIRNEIVARKGVAAHSLASPMNVSTDSVVGGGAAPTAARGAGAKVYSELELRRAVEAEVEKVKADLASAGGGAADGDLRSRFSDKEAEVDVLNREVRQLQANVKRLTRELSAQKETSEDSGTSTQKELSTGSFSLKYLLLVSLVVFLLGLLFGRRLAQ